MSEPTNEPTIKPAEPTAEGAAANRPPVTLDLDVLEREGGPRQPFVFRHGGKDYMLSDPSEIDWQNLILALRDPTLFFRFTMPRDDHEQFFTTPMPSWKLNKLIDLYMKHYGLPTGPEAPALPR